MNGGLLLCDGYYTAPVKFLVSRWFGYPGCYTVCGLGASDFGFVDPAMKAVVDDFGNLVRVS